MLKYVIICNSLSGPWTHFCNPATEEDKINQTMNKCKHLINKQLLFLCILNLNRQDLNQFNICMNIIMY